MLESSDVNHVAKFLAYYMRADRRNEWVGLAEAEHAPERVVTWLKTACPNAATNARSGSCLSIASHRATSAR